MQKRGVFNEQLKGNVVAAGYYYLIFRGIFRMHDILNAIPGIRHNPFFNKIFGEQPFAGNTGRGNFLFLDQTIHLLFIDTEIFRDLFGCKHFSGHNQIPSPGLYFPVSGVKYLFSRRKREAEITG
jgi:hypothetical protein